MKFMSLFLVLFAASAARADIVCEGETWSGSKFVLTVLEDSSAAQVRVLDEEGKLLLQEDYPELENVWDGHMTGLMTARGLSFKYESHFGIIRNAVITTNVRADLGYIDTITVPICR